MPPFQLRRYQSRIVEETHNKSAIVLLPTGAGKTAIGSEVIARVLKRTSSGHSSLSSHQTKKVVFLAPKCMLIEQQASAIRNWIHGTPGLGPAIQVGEFGGGKALPNSFHVLVSTPEAFRRKQISNPELLGWDQFSLVVFDEVHGSLKDSPYRKLALGLSLFHSRKAAKGLSHVASASGCSSHVVQVLGMTASLSYGVTERTVQASINQLTQELRITHMATASTEEMARDGYTATRGGTEVVEEGGWAKSESGEMIDLQSNDVTGEAAVGVVPPAERKPHLMLATFFKRHRSGSCTLFARGLLLTIDSIQKQIKTLDPTFDPIFPGKTKRLGDWGAKAHKLFLRSRGDLQRLFELLEHFCESVRLVIIGWEEPTAACMALKYLEMFGVDGSPKSQPLPREVGEVFTRQVLVHSPNLAKFDNLRRTLLKKHKERHEGGGALRVVIFVEQRVATHVLAHFINTDPQLRRKFKATWIYAVGSPATPRLSLNRTEEREHLADFKKGAVSILVATAAAEEGMDVPAANLTISFDAAHTPVAHTQRRGRARQADSCNVVLSQRADRPAELLEEMVQMQGRIVANFTPVCTQAADKELRAKQTSREHKARSVLMGGPGDKVIQLVNTYSMKTKGNLEEAFKKNKAGEWCCSLRYSTCLRDLSVEGAAVGKKEAKKNASLKLFQTLQKEMSIGVRVP